METFTELVKGKTRQEDCGVTQITIGALMLRNPPSFPTIPGPIRHVEGKDRNREDEKIKFFFSNEISIQTIFFNRICKFSTLICKCF